MPPDLAYDLAQSGPIAGGAAAAYYGTYAGRPAASIAGRIAYLTDAPISTWVDTGTAWAPVINGVIGAEPPLVGAFAWFNQGAAAANQLNGAIEFTGVNDGASPGQLRGKTLANVVNTAYCELGVEWRSPGDSTAGHFASAMPILREAATGKAYGMLIFIDAANFRTALQVEVWSSNTVRAAFVAKGLAVFDPNAPLFLRVRRTATDLFAEVSRNRVAWTQLDTRTIASVYTTAPDQVGFAGAGINMAPTYNVIHFLNGS